jgi:mannose-6-phosphate isomerase-like protein (cupin superfamily)
LAVAMASFLFAFLMGTAGRADDMIAGIGLTRLTVYEQRRAPDGLNSGSPHVHAVTDEAYYVLSGTGRVELHDLAHGFRTVELAPGAYVQFPPCTLHRVISTHHLVILAVMGNSGLAERGDARIYFGRSVDDDPAEYARLLDLPRDRGLEGALDRRDAAVRAYLQLLGLWTTDRKAYRAELARFIDLHLAAAASLRREFSTTVDGGIRAWAERTAARLSDLPTAPAPLGPYVFRPPAKPLLGMCGLLEPVAGLESVDR